MKIFLFPRSPIPVITALALAIGAVNSFSQEFYVPASTGGGASGQALREGGIAQDLGVAEDQELEAEPITEAATGLSPLNLLARKPFKITVSIREGFDDNVNTSRTDRQSSFYTNLAAGISYNFGSPRLKLSTNLGMGYTMYTGSNVTRPDRLSALWDLAAIYSVSPRMTIAFGTSTGYYSQPNITVSGTNISQQGDYFSSSSNISLLYQWAPRFSTTTSYNFNVLYYVDSDINSNQGRITQTFSQALNFMFWPTTTLVAEYRVSPTTYFDADLNTFNQFALVGFDHVFSPRSTWNARAGAQFNILNNPVDGTGSYVGPYMESAFTYRYGRRSQMAFTMRYGTEASGLNNVTQRQTFRAGVGITHGLTARLTASAGAFYGVNYYDQDRVISSFYENVFEGTLGLNYNFNRYLSLSAGYRFTGVMAPEAQSREYSRNIIFLGLNSTF